MLKAILLDLDDTLLVNSMDTFVLAYFQALTRYVGHRIPKAPHTTEAMHPLLAAMANANGMYRKGCRPRAETMPTVAVTVRGTPTVTK